MNFKHCQILFFFILILQVELCLPESLWIRRLKRKYNRATSHNKRHWNAGKNIDKIIKHRSKSKSTYYQDKPVDKFVIGIAQPLESEDKQISEHPAEDNSQNKENDILAAKPSSNSNDKSKNTSGISRPSTTENPPDLSHKQINIPNKQTSLPVVKLHREKYCNLIDPKFTEKYQQADIIITGVVKDVYGVAEFKRRTAVKNSETVKRKSRPRQYTTVRPNRSYYNSSSKRRIRVENNRKSYLRSNSGRSLSNHGQLEEPNLVSTIEPESRPNSNPEDKKSRKLVMSPAQTSPDFEVIKETLKTNITDEAGIKNKSLNFKCSKNIQLTHRKSKLTDGNNQNNDLSIYPKYKHKSQNMIQRQNRNYKHNRRKLQSNNHNKNNNSKNLNLKNKSRRQYIYNKQGRLQKLNDNHKNYQRYHPKSRRRRAMIEKGLYEKYNNFYAERAEKRRLMREKAEAVRRGKNKQFMYSYQNRRKYFYFQTVLGRAEGYLIFWVDFVGIRTRCSHMAGRPRT